MQEIELSQEDEQEEQEKEGEPLASETDARAGNRVGGGGLGGERGDGASAGGLVEYPPLEKSTVMFLHVFKCAGSTTR